MTRSASASVAPIPVTFLVGFLGAGKTTLLNRLLSTPGGPPIAVVVNEFGDAGIDGGLVVGGQEELVELDGGCVCCTVRGDLARTLRELAARRRRRIRRRLKFERVVIEASGLASPGPAVQTLILDSELAACYAPDGVVALASLAAIHDQVARFPEAGEQLAYADLVVETHGDRASDAQRAQARTTIDALAPTARRAEALRGEIPSELVFDLHPDPSEWAQRIERMAAKAAARGRVHAEGHLPTAGDGCCVVGHTSGVTAVSLRARVPLERATLTMWLRFLGQSRRFEILRIKGKLSLAGESAAQVVQGVHQWLEVDSIAEPAPAESILVIIGRNLDPAELQRGWSKLVLG